MEGSITTSARACESTHIKDLTMSPLLKLPEELISNICMHSRETISNLRLVCRQLLDCSFHAFLVSFFRELTISAHPSSIGVLNEIASHAQFASAVRHLIIYPHGLFALPNAFSHDILVKGGIIRGSLARALRRLPNCKIVSTTWGEKTVLVPSDEEQGEEEMPESYPYEGDAKSLWLSDAGYCFASYILCDIIHVAISCSHNIQEVVLEEANIEYVPLAEYLKHSEAKVVSNTNIKTFMLQFTNYETDVDDRELYTISRRQRYDAQEPPAVHLESLLRRLPSLTRLSLVHDVFFESEIFPNKLPSTLRVLKLDEEYTERSCAAALITTLRQMVNLEELDISGTRFTDIEQVQTLLRVVAAMPLLRNFTFFPMKENHLRMFCIVPLGQEHKCSEWVTVDPAIDIPDWIAQVRHCHNEED